MARPSRTDDVRRIREALDRVAALFQAIGNDPVSISYAHNGDPVTSMDRAINQVLHAVLPKDGEGWLSEESADDPIRLSRPRLWIVDPIDGTREFVEKIPEWCVSVGLVEDGRAVAGGILNPITGECFVGSVDTGFERLRVEAPQPVNGPSRLLVSRREHAQGKWLSFAHPDLEIRPVGSIAYRLALVASGSAEATCTFEPRSEWDVAGGVALVLAAGGSVQAMDGSPIRFNQQTPKLPSFSAFAARCPASLPDLCGVTRAVNATTE